jgi:hypothetical protein
MKTRLRLLVCLSALVATGIVASGAWGAKPETEPIVIDEPEEFAAGDVCPFAVLIEPDLVGRATTFSDGRTQTRLRGTVGVTNASSGESVSLGVSASATVTELPDGDLRSTTRGRALLFYAEGDVIGPGLFYTKGRVVETFDGTTGAITAVELSGQRADVCALLS